MSEIDPINIISPTLSSDMVLHESGMAIHPSFTCTNDIQEVIYSAPTFIQNQKSQNDSKQSSTNRSRKYYESHKQIILEKRRIRYELTRKRSHIKQQKLPKQLWKSISNKKYYEKVKHKILFLKALQNKHLANDIRYKKKLYYIMNKYSILEKRKRLRIPTSKMKRKCRKMTIKKSTRNLLQSKEYYVNDVANKIDLPSPASFIEAEKIVTAVIYARDLEIEQTKKSIKMCQNKVEVSLARLGKESISGNEVFAATALCGLAKHSSKAEAYFADSSYNFQDAFKNLKNIVVNTQGQSTNILALESSNTWFCNKNCKTLDTDILQTLADLFKAILNVSYTNGLEFYRDIDICSCESRNHNKLGHPKLCYDQPLLCKSMFLKLNYLSAHYPYLRMIKRIIYSIKSSYRKIYQIDDALNSCNIVELKNIANLFNESRTRFDCPENVICLDNVKIKEKYKDGIIEYQKIDRDPPSTSCISCERLFCLKNMQEYKDKVNVVNTSYHLRKKEPVNYKIEDDSEELSCTADNEKENIKDPSFKENNQIWRKFLKLRDPSEFENAYICNNCKVNFDKNNLPSNCILNNMFTDEVPSEIAVLNECEKMIIQRAKAFQTVVKKNTVMKKQLPHYVKIDKVIGRTFHLPLPIEETLKKNLS